MKKYFAVLFLIAFIVPSVASASWWNPFSWKIFQKKEVAPQVQVETQKTSEEKISELQKQLDDLKKEQPDSKPSTFKKEVKKDTPVVDNSAIIKAQQDTLIAKQKADEQAIIDAQKVEAERQAQLEAEKQAKADYDKYIKEIREETERINEQIRKEEKKSDALDAINLKIANLNTKYAEDMKKCNSSGGLVSGANSCKNSTTNTYYDDYNTLMAEWQQVKYSD